jgi:hypothetical protein
MDDGPSWSRWPLGPAGRRPRQQCDQQEREAVRRFQLAPVRDGPQAVRPALAEVGEGNLTRTGQRGVSRPQTQQLRKADDEFENTGMNSAGRCRIGSARPWWAATFGMSCGANIKSDNGPEDSEHGAGVRGRGGLLGVASWKCGIAVRRFRRCVGSRFGELVVVWVTLRSPSRGGAAR